MISVALVENLILFVTEENRCHLRLLDADLSQLIAQICRFALIPMLPICTRFFICATGGMWFTYAIQIRSIASRCTRWSKQFPTAPILSLPI